MVKPIGRFPQPNPVKSNVEEAGAKTGKEQAASTNKTVPIYNEKAQIARRAEHSLMGQAQAMKLQTELQRAQGGSMSIPRMKWETDVKNTDGTPVPTPYPNFASANQKDESKK